MAVLIAILVSVTLSAPFGDASARVLGTPNARTIDVSVEVEGEPAAVIARLTGLAGELDPVALVPRGGGAYGQTIQLTAWENLQVVFEYIDDEGETELSEATSLIELGIDPQLFGISEEAPAEEPADGTAIDPWLLAGVAAALAALVLMVFWASGGLTLPSKVDDWTFSGTVEAGEEPVSADEPAPAGEAPRDEAVTSDEGAG